MKFCAKTYFINYYKQNMSSPMCQIGGILPKLISFFKTKSSPRNNLAEVSQQIFKSSLLFKLYLHSFNEHNEHKFCRQLYVFNPV